MPEFRRLITIVVLSVSVAVLQAAAESPKLNFDQGVDVASAFKTMQEGPKDSRLQEGLQSCGRASAASRNRCQFMGLEKEQCLYVCRDGRRILMPLPPDLEGLGSRACLQYIEADTWSKEASAPAEDPQAACKKKCYAQYKTGTDACYEMFDNPAGLRPCLHQVALGYGYCTKSCEPSQPAQPAK